MALGARWLTMDPIRPLTELLSIDPGSTPRWSAWPGTDPLPMPRPLRGRRFGLMYRADDAHRDDLVLLERAAAQLGAKVAHIRPWLTEDSAALDVALTAKLLGRLYDAVVCQGMAPALVARLRSGAGIPVFDGIESRSHPIAALAECLDPAASAGARRQQVLQALLMKTVD